MATITFAKRLDSSLSTDLVEGIFDLVRKHVAGGKCCGAGGGGCMSFLSETPKQRGQVKRILTENNVQVIDFRFTSHRPRHAGVLADADAVGQAGAGPGAARPPSPAAVGWLRTPWIGPWKKPRRLRRAILTAAWVACRLARNIVHGLRYRLCELPLPISLVKLKIPCYFNLHGIDSLYGR